MTQLAGIFGYPLAHSLSPAFQQAAFNHYSMDVRYLAWETPSSDFATEVTKLRSGDFVGANVTIPYKELAMGLMDEVDPLAEAIGAVNTVVKSSGRLVGHNTDAVGFIRALKEDGDFEPSGKRVLMLGAGGAARAAVYALCEAGAASITIANRTVGRAQSLAADMSRSGTDVSAVGLDAPNMEEISLGSDLIVNCTPLGMRDGGGEEQTPIAGGLIPHDALAVDMVYNPQQTPFLIAARNAGARTQGGMHMLVYQGAASFELWTGKEAPIDAMFAAANVALLNMG